MFLLLLMVFSKNLGQEIPYYPLYLLLGIIMFNFFQNVTIESTRSIHNNRLIIKSINFPREVLIGSLVLKTLFAHIFEIVVFLVFLFVFNVSLANLIWYPFILIFFCFFTYGISLFLSALTVYVVDLEHIWIFASRLIWFLTPIFYTIGANTKLFFLNIFNPMYYFITVTRDLIIYSKPPEWWLIGGIVVYTFLIFIMGLLVFNSLKYRFAEII